MHNTGTKQPDIVLDDIFKFGEYPYIVSYNHGGMIQLKPSSHEITQGSIKFTANARCYASISRAGDVYLEEKQRPANMIKPCRKCYAVKQKNTDKCLFEIYWIK